MAYDAIINGARSLAFYGGNIAGCWNAADRQFGWNWTFWSTVLKPLIGELNSTSPLARASRRRRINPRDERSVDPGRQPPRSQERWVIAARHGPGASAVTISGLRGVESGTVYTENRTIAVTNGAFSDEFPSGASATTSCPPRRRDDHRRYDDRGAHRPHRPRPRRHPRRRRLPSAPAASPFPPPASTGGRPANLGVSLAPSATVTHPGGFVEVTATVGNTGGGPAQQTHLELALPAGWPRRHTVVRARRGCAGAQQLDCFLDYLPSGDQTRVVFGVRATTPGQQTITATVSADTDSDQPTTRCLSRSLSSRPCQRRDDADQAHGRPDVLGSAPPIASPGRPGTTSLRARWGGHAARSERQRRAERRSRRRPARRWAGTRSAVRRAGADVLLARDGRQDVVDYRPGRDSAVADRVDRVSGARG